MALKELTDSGLLKSFRLHNADVEKAFAGTDGARLDDLVRARPDDVFADMQVALVSVPSVGRSLLDEASWKQLAGRVRLFNWLPRRKECGKPCQTCRHRCDYSAIAPDGAIRDDDCFQCMDCVVIYQSDDKYASLILEKKRRASIPIKAV